MVVAVLILVFSTAMLFFYFEVSCQKILRLQFGREYLRSVVNAHGLEFPSLRESLKQGGTPVDYSQLRAILNCDFLTLTHLLKNVVNGDGRFSNSERLLIVYFRWQLLWLAVCHLLTVGEKRAALRLSSVLEYFANEVGQHVEFLRRLADVLDAPLFEASSSQGPTVRAVSNGF